MDELWDFIKGLLLFGLVAGGVAFACWEMFTPAGRYCAAKQNVWIDDKLETSRHIQDSLLARARNEHAQKETSR